MRMGYAGTMSERHVYAVASGFGVRVIPACAPFRLTLQEASLDLVLECQQPDGWRSASIAAKHGEHTFKLGEGTASLAEVADVEAGPDWDGWWIETSVYRIPLPVAWTLHASGEPNDVARFDLLGPAGSAIFIQTPRRMRSLTSLLGPGQEFRDTGQLDRAAWIEFDYSHEGAPWIQRHEMLHRGLTPFVVTLQAPADSLAARIDTLAHVVEGIEVSETHTRAASR